MIQRKNTEYRLDSSKYLALGVADVKTQRQIKQKRHPFANCKMIFGVKTKVNVLKAERANIAAEAAVNAGLFRCIACTGVGHGTRNARKKVLL